RIEGSKAPRIAVSGVVNAASSAPGLVAGSLVTVHAAGVRNDPGVASALPPSTELDGVSVMVNGVLAPILAVSNTNGVEKVTFQVPFEAAGGTASVAVSRSGLSSAAVEAPVADVQPGVYTDSMLVPEQQPLARGELATIYASGLGLVTNPPATGSAAPDSPPSSAVVEVGVTLAGVRCEVQFAGLAPNMVGVYQVTFRTPASTPSGMQELVVTAGGASSPAVTLPVL
ncbi:MAG TPA: hypothetical protein VKE70_00365, partial [Candidatus Solibacter sp.]|nr:hypothetical protein [Candidatus Solibacter sp.]